MSVLKEYTADKLSFFVDSECIDFTVTENEIEKALKEMEPMKRAEITMKNFIVYYACLKVVKIKYPYVVFMTLKSFGHPSIYDCYDNYGSWLQVVSISPSLNCHINFVKY